MSTETGAEMTCKEFVELVTDLIEGQLAEAERAEAEMHVAECDGCATYLEQIQATIAGFRSLAQSDDFPRTREQAVAAFGALRAATRRSTSSKEKGAVPAGTAPDLPLLEIATSASGC